MYIHPQESKACCLFVVVLVAEFHCCHHFNTMVVIVTGVDLGFNAVDVYYSALTENAEIREEKKH